MTETFTPPAPEIVAVWTRLIRAGRHVRDAIETALKAEGLPPLDWYDALWEVEQAADGIRPMTLEERLLLPQYGLSRLVDRLVAAGYVERRPCPADRRGQMLVATDAGRAVRAAMWPVYAGALNATVGAALEREAAAALAAQLGRLARV
jgi:DNA-binding MarR family transcriptional regulator